MLALAYLAAVLTGDARLEGRAEARLETRARTPTAADLTTISAGDFEVTPGLFGALENLGGRITLLYAPTLRVREPYMPPSYDENGLRRGRRVEFNQRQVLEMQWSREGHARPYLIESFYHGRTDLQVARTTAALPTPFQLGQVQEVSIDLNGGVQWPLSRLVSLDTSAGFNYGTGLDATSRAALPSQRSYRTRARLEVMLTPLDTLYGQLDANWASFPGLFTDQAAGGLAVRWRHQLVRATAFELGLLGGVVYGSFPDGTTSWVPAPGGDALLATRYNDGPHALAFDVGVRIAPFVDRYIASAYSRGEVYTTFGYLFRERWALTARGGASRSLTDVRLQGSGASEEIVTGYFEGRAGYVAPRWWRVDLTGLTSVFVVRNGDPVTNWLVSLSLTLFAVGQT